MSHAAKNSSFRVELWGGHECTVNRVGDRFLDQTILTGHQDRLEDLDRFADLGITALRYPVLWERTAPDRIEDADWRWADERLARLRALGIRPIVGLVHHGSGPDGTSLVDPTFPEKLARYAAAVAARYPWIDAFTPVNEPLTTARFSGLYGHWYPHTKDHSTFVRILLTECRAVVLAMRAIRGVNPGATLVQTDDLGKTWSTPRLAYQARQENERRWLAFDLLCGRIDSGHPMRGFLLAAGATEHDLAWFQDNACPPDVIGINHYLSSERFLDTRQERYPVESHGGNGRDNYADVLATRARKDGTAGPEVLLRETWQRYGLPIAVTEAHNGCTREEQMRWFLEVWDAAERLRGEGVDIRAVTAWSLLGADGWNTLVTGHGGKYEPGVFDASGPAPRPTAMAGMLKDLAAGRRPDHPLLEIDGWWRRPIRFEYGVVVDARGRAQPAPGPDSMDFRVRRATTRPVIITGATGTLGNAFARFCELRGIPYLLTSREDMDIADADMVAQVLDEYHPWAVINTAGYVRVDDAEGDATRCRRENAFGPECLAGACAPRRIKLLTFSSDLVFDGRSTRPYHEADAIAPLNEYGRSKAEGEARVLHIMPNALIARTSAFFGPWDEYNFVTLALRALGRGEQFTAVSDQTVSPTYVPDLVNAALDLLIDGESGIWHLANTGAMTWADLAMRVADAAGLGRASIETVNGADLRLPAARPAYSALGTRRGQVLPDLDDALQRYFTVRAEIELIAGRARAAS